MAQRDSGNTHLGSRYDTFQAERANACILRNSRPASCPWGDTLDMLVENRPELVCSFGMGYQEAGEEVKCWYGDTALV